MTTRPIPSPSPVKTITSLQLNITSVSSATQNIGLAEIQVYNNSTGGGNRPVANAGANQTVGVNATVQLDGSGSSDPNGNPLTYSVDADWRPNRHALQQHGSEANLYGSGQCYYPDLPTGGQQRANE